MRARGECAGLDSFVGEGKQLIHFSHTLPLPQPRCPCHLAGVCILLYKMADKDADGRKVFVGGIPFGVDQHNIREDFGKFGEIEDVYMPMDRETGKYRGFGFVTFASPRDAEEASQAMNG